MAAKKMAFRRILAQTDLAFWCIHDHVGVLSVLGLPTLAAFVASALGAVSFFRNTVPPEDGFLVFLGTILASVWLLLVFIACPLPCAVFAWKLASEEQPTAGECYAFCVRRSGRLIWAFVRLVLAWLAASLFWPVMLWLLPRTCFVPMVALFENERKVFRRAARVLREDNAVVTVGLIYTGMALVLAGVVFLPRVLFSTRAFGSNLLESSTQAAIVEWLWVVEGTTLAVLLTAIAMCWSLSLTFVYHDIRSTREGEQLKKRIEALGERLAL